jgi:hypothetical protein
VLRISVFGMFMLYAMLYIPKSADLVVQGTKYWLTGYYFNSNSAPSAEVATNANLAGFLNPTTDEYRDYFAYVYDVAGKFSICFLVVVTL